MTARVVVDASAVLAWLQEEPGADRVDPLLPGAAISTVNWSEVLQKVAQRRRDPGEVGDLLLAVGIDVVPLTIDDAADAAALWLQVPSLSLGDRCCLALARRLGLPAITVDRDWLALSANVDVRLVR